ncbi:MAG: GNAT family N-acetyltransferase [Phenylobacterium sp.]|jgi:GNAT superfamily N-acetyltransferase|uniref:GNAT family N-acetyltransferase n=1 Tax=Phenylobacterium sp. TaxID=1871053 RepID=UPI003919DF82
MDDADLQVRPVTEATWADLERLFEGRGGPKYCWCMAWRPMENRASARPEARKSALRARVAAGTPIGLIGYLAGEPVAWCSVGPRESFTRLRPDQDGAEPGVWSVTCFFIRRDHRGRGLTGRLLEAAADYARAHGGRILEAYPVDPESPSYRFMGFRALYATHGFEAVGRAGSRRHVVRRRLRAEAGRGKAAP